MTTYNFTDSGHDRCCTGSVKWDRYPEHRPFWIADMDFPVAPEISQAIMARMEHPYYGYSQAHESLIKELISYFARQHKATVSEETFVHTGGTVPSLYFAAKVAITSLQDRIITCSPIYPPFLAIAEKIGVQHDVVPYNLANDRVEFDWEQLEQIATKDSKVFLLCNPQNPLARNFSAAEIRRIADFCLEHDLLLVSDEIHCDLVLDEQQEFYSALQLGTEYQDNLIVLQSPNKTYNTAGMGYGVAIIYNEKLRQKFQQELILGSPEIGALHFYTAEAAYRDGEPWRQALLKQLRINNHLVEEFLARELPQVRYQQQEATYLKMLDFSYTNWQQPAQEIAKLCDIMLSEGSAFGAPYCARLNFACPQTKLLAALETLAQHLPK